nr:putative E3 ubiquitin-protein ligase RF298 [Ipomoea batatas]GMD79672.1 putative E3 ubiquitin-protein ligase RF298 [Ipomoea batatas]
MVNPNAVGGEGNSKGDKGKGKMVMEDNSDGHKGKGKMIKTSKDDNSPVLPELDLQSYETLAESLHKQMVEVKAWKEKSEESTVKEGKEKEEEEERKECPEWDDPLALQLEELLIHNLRGSFQTAIKKIAANGYSMEQAEWAVLTSGFYIGNSDITSNIVAAAMAFLAKKEEYFEIDPSERHIFESVENMANYALVEMVNVLKQRKKQLERELQGWSDWTSVRVGQTAQKLRRNKEEMKKLRQEAAATDDNNYWTHNEKHIYELDLAVNNVKSLMETVNATLLELQAEHTILLKKLEDSKLLSLSPNQILQEIKVREQELLKQSRKLEAEKKFFQEDLARLKAEAAKLQQQIDKARKRQHEFEVLQQHEEREKIKHLQKAESIRREREEMKQKTKMEEEKLKERVKYEERMKEIRAQISAIKLGESSSGKAEAKKRERECVMCLNLDKTNAMSFTKGWE